jgi:hypothetical protein
VGCTTGRLARRPDGYTSVVRPRERREQCSATTLPELKTEEGVADIGFAYAAWIVDPNGNALGILELKG